MPTQNDQPNKTYKQERIDIIKAKILALHDGELDLRNYEELIECRENIYKAIDVAEKDGIITFLEAIHYKDLTAKGGKIFTEI